MRSASARSALIRLSSACLRALFTLEICNHLSSRASASACICLAAALSALNFAISALGFTLLTAFFALSTSLVRCATMLSTYSCASSASSMYSTTPSHAVSGSVCSSNGSPFSPLGIRCSAVSCCCGKSSSIVSLLGCKSSFCGKFTSPSFCTSRFISSTSSSCCIACG